MAEEEVGLRTTLKDRVQTARGLDEIDRKVTGVGRSAETAGRRAAIGARGFNSLRKAGRLAAVGATAAFTAAVGAGYGLLRLVRSSFEEAREAQKVGALTRSTIKATGRAAHVTAPQVERLANGLSEMAGVDDELIQTGSNLLLTFKNIRNEVGRGNKIFDRATKSALDLSTTPFYNGNMVGASKALGKALNDPLKGVTALSKAGVQFSAGQIDQIKNFVEQNDLLSAQKIILGEVNSQVGGAAKAQRTWGDVASVTWKNLEERLGTGLLPLMDRFNRWFSRKGADQIDGYFDVFEAKGIPALSRFSRKALPLAEQVLPSVATALGDVRDVLATAAPYAADLVGAFKDMPGWARKALVGGGLAAYAGKKTGIFSGLQSLLGSKSSGGLLGAVSKAKPLPVFVVNNGIAGTGLGGGLGPKGTVAAGERGLLAKAGATAITPVKFLPQAIVAALATAGIFKLQNKVAPDSPIKGMNPDMGQGTGGLPQGTNLNDLDQAGDDYRKLFGQIGGYFNNIFGSGGSVPQDSEASRQSLIDLFLTPAGLAPQYRSGTEQLLISPLKAADAQTTQLGTNLGKVGATRVSPEFTTPGLPGAVTDVSGYKDLLGVVGKPVNTRINVDTSAALAAVHNFASQAAAALAMFGGGSAAPAAPATPKVPKPPKTPPASSDKLPAPKLGRGRTEIPVYLDGKEIARAIHDEDRRELANL